MNRTTNLFVLLIVISFIFPATVIRYAQAASATRAGISLTESYFGLLVPMLIIAFGTGLGFTAINIAALTGTKKGEEGLASGLINTSRQIGGPIGLAVLLTVANFGSPDPTAQLVQSAAAIVTGFGYALLAAALLTGIGIIFAALIKQERRCQAKVVASTIRVKGARSCRMHE